MTAWTDELTDQVKKMWEAGLSASQIAAEIGNGFTRNAVIGRIHRKGWSGRTKGAVSPKGNSRPKQYAARARAVRSVSGVKSVSRAATALAESHEVERDQEVLTADNVIPMHQRLSLLELTAANCHWPVGDPQSPDFFFCGGRALAGLPYCRHHTGVARASAYVRKMDRRPTR